MPREHSARARPNVRRAKNLESSIFIKIILGVGFPPPIFFRYSNQRTENFLYSLSTTTSFKRWPRRSKRRAAHRQLCRISFERRQTSTNHFMCHYWCTKTIWYIKRCTKFLRYWFRTRLMSTRLQNLYLFMHENLLYLVFLLIKTQQ